MGLEVASNISQLVESNPLGTDNRSQGDDHIRLIKSCLKTTFPGVTGTVTVTHTQINQLGVPGVVCFPGMIVMWSGTLASVPAGWQLCNGTGTITGGLSVPDLRSRFIIGSGGDSGGSFNTRQTGGTLTHTHTGTIGGTALTIDQIPAHSHTLATDGNGGSDIQSMVHSNNADENPAGAVTGSVGGGQAHTHTATITDGANVPPYYALAFIIKI